jgi:hypothetical protein
MKKISTIIMALVIVMTMAQCKKDSPTTPDNQNNVVTITLDVKNNNGSRVDVNTTTGTVDFETGDKVYVGSGGKYVGFLTHNGTNFVGNITNPTENQPLQFYFLGNVTPTETLSAGTTEECSVIISDQTEHLPVISCAASFENYVSGLTSYTGHLLNKCALVKFNVTTPSNSPICITGMKNKVTVDFSQNTVTPSIDGDGVIMLSAGSGENVEKWAILLPQEALETGRTGTVFSNDGVLSGIRPAIPVISSNGYNADGISVSVTIPRGALNGVFAISENQQVRFSQGNLQYQASTNTWRFAENQWDFVGGVDYQGIQYGNVSGSSNNNISATYSGWIDLFGWGTSGYNHGAICYQPWSISETNSDYYAYGSNLSNLYDQTGQADWGYNSISNGGNQENLWRTLTEEEWRHILFQRNTSSGIRYAKAVVNEINGLILLPDDWEESIFVLNNINQNDADFSSNIISASQWMNMELNGAVFLPNAGGRSGTMLGAVSSYGRYWSSSINDYYKRPCELRIDYLLQISAYYGYRYNGNSVRLIKNVD